MRTIILTDQEHYRLLIALRDLLRPDSYLGSKFIHECSTQVERRELEKIRQKLERLQRDA